MSARSTTADFLRLLREDPEFRAQVRHELQIQELMELPEKFAAFVSQTQEEFSEIKSRLARLEEIVAAQQTAISDLQDAVVRLQKSAGMHQVILTSIDGKLGRLEGAEYERRVSRTFIGALSNALGGLRRGRLVHSGAYGTIPEFYELMEDSADDGKIAFEQWYEILCADAIVRGVKDGETVYAAAEISLTVHQSDIDRAAERAAIIQQATGASTYPIVVGDSIPFPQQAQAESKGVTVIIVQQ